MTPGRRGRGGFERGARRGSTSTRGTSFRGNHTAARTTATNGTNTPETTTTTATPSGRGQSYDRGQRGGTFRGGARGNTRARGGHMTLANGASTANQPTTTNRVTNIVTNTTPFAQDDYEARLKYLRAKRPEVKEQLIKAGRMDPDGQMNVHNSVKRMGLCMELCPELERVRRIVERDLLAPEYTPESLRLGDRSLRVPDESRMVKAHTRSGAGSDAPLICDVRPPSVCLKSMDYLIERLYEEDVLFLHNWLWDRARAVRTDLNRQDIDDPEDRRMYLECHEKDYRLHLIFLHHMSKLKGFDSDLDYSHHEDVVQLNQSSISLKQHYEDNRRKGTPCPSEPEFQAYRIVVALYTGDKSVEDETQSESVRRNRKYQTAKQITHAAKAVFSRNRSPSAAQQNWKAFWDLVKSPAVSYLLACAAEMSFNNIRFIILDTIYRTRLGPKFKELGEDRAWTIAKLTEVLGFDDTDEVREYCGRYGFTFLTSQDSGEPYLDFESVVHRKGLVRLHGSELKPQWFSRFVERKREDRPLPIVIQEGEAEPEGELDDSLFVPDFTAQSAAPGIATLPTPAFNPQAPAFNPSVPPVQPSTISPSPFSKPAPTTTNANDATPASNLFAAPSSSQFPSTAGSFGKPSSSQFPPSTGGFGKPSNTNISSTGGFGKPSDSPFSSRTSFGKPSDSTSVASTQAPFTPATTFTSSFTSPATGQTVQSGLFNPSNNSIKFSETGATPSTDSTLFSTGSSLFAPTKPDNEPAPTPGASTPFASSLQGSSASKGDSSAPTGASGLNFSPAQKPEPTGNDTPKPFAFAAGSTTNFESPPAAKPAPTTSPAKSVSFAQDDQQRLAEEEKQRAAKEEQERRAREERERQAREEEARRAREEQERRAKEEEARRAREEQERVAELLRRQEERRQQKSLALDALAQTVFLDAGEGLLGMFIEQKIKEMLPKVEDDLWHERAEKLANEMYEQKQLQRIRACVARWCEKVARKKRLGKARDRRRWLRENADHLMALQAEETPLMQRLSAGQGPTDNEAHTFRKPTVPASASRGEKRADTLDKGKAPIRSTNSTTSNKSKGKASVPAVEQAEASSSRSSVESSYSSFSRTAVSYKSRTVPVDRTETNWFKLRARGLDPTKYLKRGHDDSDEEEQRKRARTSSSSAPRPSPPAAAHQNGAGGIISRFAAVKESLNRRKSTPVPQTRSVQGSPNNTWDVIARAKALLATSTPKNSPAPAVQHDFSRSVPDLSIPPRGVRKSSFGQSHNAPAPASKPAYWGRKSRFVPQHLYGKGPDAIREYLAQSRGSRGSDSPAVVKPEPLQLSSPIPTQQSCASSPAGSAKAVQLSSLIPTQISYKPEGLSQYDDGGDHDDEGRDDDGMDVDGGEEYESQSGSNNGSGEAYSGSEGEEDEEYGEGEGEEDMEEYDDEEEEYDSEGQAYDEGLTYDDDQDEQDAQMVPGAGATQDDAIELSD